MELTDLEGAEFSVCDDPRLLAEAERQARAAGAQVLRAGWRDPDHDELRDAGFVIRPDWIMFTREVPEGTDSFLAGQVRPNRTRLAMDALATYKMSLEDPVTEKSFEEFLPLYREHMGRLPRGLDFAGQLRETVLGGDHLIATWRDDGGALVCGMIARRDHGYSLLHVRFFAVREPAPAPGTTAGMYAVAAGLAPAYGLRTLSMGIEMNFYGGVLSPGLCLYKLRLGGVPVPAGMLGDPDCGLVADKMLSVRGLRQPVLCFEQLPGAGDAPPAAGDLAAAARRLRLVCFAPSGDGGAAARPFRRWAQVRQVR
ncbi:hypothetical protein [Streptomyces purpurogeneiscleroticus]|uniref:hypothetical protein n=1 Tax=Streptomyces purpurogeneiscleroticus TaxID=68259 RepID=UPI001CBFC3E9|nr:hypothetical protein [Streptomyces purpurogeneiscleroticus]